MQSADFLVEVDQAGRDAGKATIAPVCFGRHLQGTAQGIHEGDEALGRSPGFRQRIEARLCRLDLVHRRLRVLGGLRPDGDFPADPNQVPSEGQIVDGAGVVRRVGGRWRAVNEVGEIADAAKRLEGWVPAELLCQQDGLSQLALSDLGLDR